MLYPKKIDSEHHSAVIVHGQHWTRTILYSRWPNQLLPTVLFQELRMVV
jgi:hypothetical protein